MDHWKNAEKVALSFLGAVGALVAIEKLYKHPTYGNGIKALVATLSLA